MQASDVLSRPSRPPDLVLAYGEGEHRVADVRLTAAGDDASGPATGPRIGRAPLVLFLHGGFWQAAYDRSHTGPLAEALADSGFVVCTPEYRKVGQAGGGWPGTFEDVAAAVELLPRLVAGATDGLTDDSRVILAGHSAGGHLALWAAAQRGAVVRPAGPAAGAGAAAGTGAVADTGAPAGAGRAPGGSERRGRAGVVSLAGVCDLAGAYRLGLGNGAVAELMGGGPELYPGRYAVGDPMNIAPIGVP